MALPILYMVGSMVVRAAAPAIMRQLATLGAKKLGKKAVETIVKKGTKIVTPNAGNIAKIAKNARTAANKVVSKTKPKPQNKPKQGPRIPREGDKNFVGASRPKQGPRIPREGDKNFVGASRPKQGPKPMQGPPNVTKFQRVKPKTSNANTVKKAAVLTASIASVGLNSDAKKPAAPKKKITKPDLRAFSGSTDRKAAPKTKPKPKPKPKADPGRQTSPIPINKPTDKPMTLRTYLNTAIDKRGSTLSKEKAKGKNFKSIAAAKKGKSLYYMKGDKVMAAVYKEDLKK